jgi:hypothetical protein
MPAFSAAARVISFACFFVATKRTFPPSATVVRMKLHGFLEIDDVDPVARSVDELLHLGVPTMGLVAEVDSRFEHVFH